MSTTRIKLSFVRERSHSKRDQYDSPSQYSSSQPRSYAGSVSSYARSSSGQSQQYRPQSYQGSRYSYQQSVPPSYSSSPSPSYRSSRSGTQHRSRKESYLRDEARYYEATQQKKEADRTIRETGPRVKARGFIEHVVRNY